jgi:hypothetical protein
METVIHNLILLKISLTFIGTSRNIKKIRIMSQCQHQRFNSALFAESHLIEELNIEAVVDEQCQYYVDQEQVSEMSNNLKHNLLYWWLAMDFYQIVGLGEREQLYLTV